MKRISIFILAVTTMLFACKKDTVQTVQEKSKPSLEKMSAKKKHTVPISGDLSNAPVPNAPPVICSDLFPISGQNFLYGNVSHMGKLKSGSLGTAQVCNITGFDPLRATITYTEVKVAANGDKVFSNSIIYIVGDTETGGATGTWTGSGIITGGTGRFDGATGAWDFSNARFFADGTSTWSISGNITY